MVHNNNETPTLENVIMSAIAEALSNTHTNLLAKVTKVNKTTINCKPVMSRVVNKKKIDLPEFAEVPVLNLLGGSSSIQMPISVGDYCILFVSERCFDTWHNGQDFEAPLEARMHDYSDSIALVGIKNKSGELTIPEVITMLGDVLQKGDYTHEGNRTHTGDYSLTGDMTITGNLTVSGNVSVGGAISSGGDITISGKSFLNHTHTGDSGGTTGTPN